VGVEEESRIDGGAIHNFGSINSPGIGIDIFGAQGLTTEVTNAKGASIIGGNIAVISEVGGLNFVNAGIVNGPVDTADHTATDTIINNGKINGIVNLGGAYDTFNGKKGTSGTIFTGAGHDVVQVGKGHASVDIDDGNSTITAGAGHDNFVFDHHAIGGGNVVIKHFSAGADKIELSETYFHGIGTVGTTLDINHFGLNHMHNSLPKIIYNDHNGFLYYEDGGAMTHFATLAGHPPIGHNSFLLTA
jgi:hypothetical protein